MRDIILLSTADWDNPFWTNKQHQACDFASRGFRVLYIESLGLRRPSVNAQDLGRIFRRLKKGLTPPRKVRENLWVWSPIVLPLQRFAIVRWLNRVVLSTSLRAVMLWLRMRPDVLWTYNPMTTRFLNTRRFRRVVYNCVDDIAAQPGMPSEAIREAERELCTEAEVVFATAPDLATASARWNGNVHMVGNVADYAHFSKAREEGTPIPVDLQRLPSGPRIGYIGAISGYKVNFDLVRYIAEQRPEWQIVLIGKVGEGDPWTDPSKLQGVPNLHLLGPRSYEELPGYLKGIDVAILPSQLNDYTRGMYPMKLNEYLAAGCPVVSVDLPALKEVRHVVRVAANEADFISGIEEALNGRGLDLKQRLAFASLNTYAARTDRMLAIMGAAKTLKRAA